MLCFDAAFLPIVERLKEQLPTVEHFVLFDAPAQEGYLSYRELIAAEDGRFEWVAQGERDPVGLCYTSGTTGNPKGVLYEHRSNVLHAITEIQPDAFDLRSEEHTSELQSLMRTSYAVFCLKKQTQQKNNQ